MIQRPLKWYAKLLTAKGRKKEGRYLIEGARQVSQMVENSPESLEELLVLEQSSFECGIPSRPVSESQMKQISDSETVPEIIAVGIIPDSYFEEFTGENQLSQRILFLEDVQDPGNVGTLLRSAAAFGYNTVIMSSGCADPYAPKVVRSAAGVLSALTLIRTPSPYSLLSDLKKRGYIVVTAHINGGFDTLSSVEKTIFSLGNEGNGVSESLLSLSDMLFTVPFDNSVVESLNVAIAGSIGMAQTYSK